MKVVRSIRFNPGEAKTYTPHPRTFPPGKGNLFISNERLVFQSTKFR